MQRQLQGCSSRYSSPVLQGSASSPVEAAGCDKGFVRQRHGKPVPALFTAGPALKLPGKRLRKKKKIFFSSFEKRESVTDITAREGKPDPAAAALRTRP